MIMKDYKTDEGLQGNEKIEEAIAGLQHEATQEMLAHTLTVIRRRMKEDGQFIIPWSRQKVMVRSVWRQSGRKMERTGGQHSPALRKNLKVAEVLSPHS